MNQFTKLNPSHGDTQSSEMNKNEMRLEQLDYLENQLDIYEITGDIDQKVVDLALTGYWNKLFNN